jgi:hypothetical protein
VPSRRSGSRTIAELLDGSAPPIVTSINVPTPDRDVRGWMTVPVSTHPGPISWRPTVRRSEQSGRRRRRRRCVPLRLRDPLHVRWRPASSRLRRRARGWSPAVPAGNLD